MTPMDSKREPEDPLKLFVEADRKIEAVRTEVADIIRKEFTLENKMDMLLSEQRHLKERFEEGVSKTTGKIYEMVDHIYKEIENISSSNAIRDVKLERAEHHYEWIFRGFIITFVLSVMLAVWKLK